MYDLCKEDLRINFHTMRTGIFYGSTTGMTESLAAKIAARTGVAQTDVHNVADASADEAEGYGRRPGAAANCRTTGTIFSMH